LSQINELITLIQQAEYAARQVRMDGSGVRQALEILTQIGHKKLCVKAHNEEQRLYALVAMHTGYSNDEVEMILED